MTNKKADNQIRTKKAERNALGWLFRQGAWELRLDHLHRVNLGVESGRRKVTEKPAA